MAYYADILYFQIFVPRTIDVVIAALVVLCILALSSVAEAAFLSLTPNDIKTIRNRNSPGDRAILKLLSAEEYFMTTMLVFNTLVGICLILLLNKVIDYIVIISGIFWMFAIKTLIIVSVLLLFGEIIPKMFALRSPLRLASAFARPLLMLNAILKPLTWALVRIWNSVSRHSTGNKGNISIEELSDALEMTSDQSEEEKKMLEGIVDFANTDVEEIMHPRLDITAINVESDYDEVRKVIIESGYSRIPAYRGSIDNIVGILYVKDMLRYIDEGGDFRWQNHLRDAYFIPEHKKINELLKEFQTNKIHLAIVVDEHGSTLGLLSLEDILEEVVGEITDESDKEKPYYKKLGENSYVFEGKTHIGDLLDVIGFDYETYEDIQGQAETIAGLMLEINRDFLNVGDSLTLHGVRFTVESIEGRRIGKVNIEVLRHLRKE